MALLAHGQVHGRYTFLPHFVVDTCRGDVVVGEAAVAVRTVFGHHKQRNTLGAFGSAFDAGQHQMDDIIGPVVVAGRDKYLLAFDCVGARRGFAIRLWNGGSDYIGERTTRLRLRQLGHNLQV